MDSKKWTIVKYPCVTRSENETLCSVGITNHVYLGCLDESNTEIDVIDSDDEYNTFSTTNVQDIQDKIDAEINSRRNEKPIDPYQLLAPYVKEIISLQKGRSNEEILSAEFDLRALIYKMKEKINNENNKVTGNVVTCTMGNTKEGYKRFRHKKQKFY